ncbi:hypothetical protein ABBQ32_010837 [Trebouxia sp. C0010 RCD-2024]
MVEKEQKPTPGQQQKVPGDTKSEQMQPKTSGDVAQPESAPPTDTRKCFVTTSKGSKLLLFVSQTMDVKHIMTEVAKRHNAQFKELGRVKCKFLAYCQTADDKQGFKLTNEMVLQEFANDTDEVHLVAYIEDATVATKRPAPTDGEGQPLKKAKPASGASGAASGIGTTFGDAPKKRGRPSNKEKAEKEAAAAAEAAGQAKLAADDKGKAPATAQVANVGKPAVAKPAAAKPAQALAKKEGKPKAQAAQATPAEPKQAAKAPVKTPATAPTPAANKEESSSEEESGSEEGSSSEEESSDDDKAPQQQQAPQNAESSSDDSEEQGSSSEEE